MNTIRKLRLNAREYGYIKSHMSTSISHTIGGDAMKYPVVLREDEAGGYVVECPIIPGCVSEGDTIEEALANITEAIQGCLDVRRELGMPETLEMKFIEV